MAGLKVLAIAVATGRIGYVFFIGDTLRDWGISRKASKSPALTAAKTQEWINALKPDVVVSEKPETARHKGEHTKQLMNAVKNVASHNYLLDVSVERKRMFKDKFTEASELAKQFPELLPWVPKRRRLWEPEPRNTIYFEAVALGKQFSNSPVFPGTGNQSK
jgi:hypothetical protein